jgi:hypothetical protein
MKKLFLALLLVLCSLLVVSVAAANDIEGELEFQMKFPGLNIDGDDLDMYLIMSSLPSPKMFPLSNDYCDFTYWSVSNTTTMICTFEDCEWPDECEHPFVNLPDEWDDPVIYNDRAIAYTVNQISLLMRVYKDGAFKDEGYVIEPESTYDYIPSDGSLSLANNVATTRTDIFASLGVSLPLMPNIVREAANDIGQAGIEKYRGSASDQNGCDEFYGWFAYNEGDHCAFRDVINMCAGGYMFIPFSYGCSNAYYQPNVCIDHDDSAWPSHWVVSNSDIGHWPKSGYLQHGMLYRLRFNASRTAVVPDSRGRATFAQLSSNSSYWDDDLSTIPVTSTNVPAHIGDVLWRWDNCPDDPDNPSHHAMMVISSSGITVGGAAGNHHLHCTVLEKDWLVQAVYKSDSSHDLDETCASGDPRYDYYLGHGLI